LVELQVTIANFNRMTDSERERGALVGARTQ
jgi:hypothetical protein